MFYLLGLGIFLFSVWASVFTLRGNILDIINIPSMILIIFPLVAVLTATQNFKIFAAGFKAAVFPKSDISDDIRGKAASLFRFLSKTTIFIMLIAFLICFILLLMGLDFDDPKAIGRIGYYVCAAIITPIYGLILIAAVFEPIVIILKKRGDKERK